MTFEQKLYLGLAAALAVCVWLPWFLTRRPKPKRGGYIHRR